MDVMDELPGELQPFLEFISSHLAEHSVMIMVDPRVGDQRAIMAALDRAVAADDQKTVAKILSKYGHKSLGGETAFFRGDNKHSKATFSVKDFEFNTDQLRDFLQSVGPDRGRMVDPELWTYVLLATASNLCRARDPMLSLLLSSLLRLMKSPHEGMHVVPVSQHLQ